MKRRPISPTASPIGSATRLPTYVPLAYHKQGKQMGVMGKNRPDNPSKCPNGLTIEYATNLLQLGYKKNAIDKITNGQWPKVIYTMDSASNQLFMAICSNSNLGWYHGFPISENECPSHIKINLQHA
jgi:hypothetical protein